MSHPKPELNFNDQPVIDYLKTHPDFFQRNPDLLAQLHLPEQNPGTIPLIQRQLSQLQQANEQYQQRHKQWVTHAQHNEHLFAHTRTLILQLIPAKNLDQLHEILVRSLTEVFKIDCVHCGLFKEAINAPNTLWPIKSVTDLEHQFKGLSKDKIICGFLREQQRAFLFSEQTPEIQSSALALLYHQQQPLGYIALGSQDSEQFKHTMGTLFIEYMAQALSAKILQLSN